MNQAYLGRRIRQERQRIGMTQEQLAEAINVSSTYIGYIERGERSVTLEKLILLANTFHVSIDYLLHDSLDTSSLAIDNQLKQLWSHTNPEQKSLILDIIKSILAHSE